MPKFYVTCGTFKIVLDRSDVHIAVSNAFTMLKQQSDKSIRLSPKVRTSEQGFSAHPEDVLFRTAEVLQAIDNESDDD